MRRSAGSLLVAQTSVCALLVWVFPERRTQIKPAQAEACATRSPQNSSEKRTLLHFVLSFGEGHIVGGAGMFDGVEGYRNDDLDDCARMGISQDQFPS